MLPSDSLCGKVSDLVGNVAPDALASDPHAAATRRRAPHKKIEESLSPCQIAMSPRVFVECLDIMSLIMKGTRLLRADEPPRGAVLSICRLTDRMR